MVSTQWIVGMDGPTGLNYGSVMAIMREMGITGSASLTMLGDIRVMESEALKTMRT